MNDVMKIRMAPFVLAIAACLLAGCGTYSAVSERRPHFVPVPVGGGVLTNAEAEIAQGLRQEQRQPAIALDEFLAAARIAE